MNKRRFLAALFTVVAIPIALTYLWEEIRPVKLHGYFESLNIQVPKCLLSPNSEGHINRQLALIELKNNRDEDVSLKNLQFDSMKGYSTLNISFPQERLPSPNEHSYKVAYSNNVVTMTGDVVIPAGLGIVIHLWGEKVSPWPQIRAMTDKGEITVVWRPQLSGRLQLLFYEHLHWLIVLFIVLNAAALVYFTGRRKR